MEWSVKQSVNTATKDQDLAVVLDSLIKVNRNYPTDLWDLVYPVHHLNFSVLQGFESLVGLFLDFYDLFLVRCFVNVVGVIAQILIIVGLFVKLVFIVFLVITARVIFAISRQVSVFWKTRQLITACIHRSVKSEVFSS